MIPLAVLGAAACALDHPVFDHARAHAYVSGDGGIDEITLATCASRRVYTTPDDQPDFCARMSREVPAHPLADGVIALADGDTTLVLERYGVGCHVPDHERVRVTDFADAARARAHPEHRIYAIAANAGVIIAVDGDGLLRSTDAGDTWTQVKITPPDSDVDSIGLGIVADTIAIDRGHLIVGTLRIPEIGGRFEPGPVLRSDDDGATWTRAKERRPRRARSITQGRDRFDATDDGVIRTRAHAKARVTPDPTTAPERDLFELYVLHPT